MWCLAGKTSDSEDPGHPCGCMYLHCTIFPAAAAPPGSSSLPPCRSILGVPKVSATHTFPDAQIAPWSSPKPDQWGWVMTPALASLCLTPSVSTDIFDSCCWSAHRQQPHRLRSRQKPCTASCTELPQLQQPVCTRPRLVWAPPARLCQHRANDLEP